MVPQWLRLVVVVKVGGSPVVKVGGSPVVKVGGCG